MLSDKEIVCPNNLLNVAHKKKGVVVGIVNAGKPLPMLSVMDAVNENLIIPIEEYSPSQNIISIDLPDHGQSPWTNGFTLEAAVTGIVEILDNYQIDKAAFLGHSLGGKVVMQFALLNPDRVSHLIVADIAPVK